MSSKYVALTHANIHIHTKAYSLGFCGQSGNVKERLIKEEKFNQRLRASSDYKRRMDGDSRKRKNKNVTAIAVLEEVHFSEEESEPQRDEVSLRS